jgi:hypothetical protein
MSDVFISIPLKTGKRHEVTFEKLEEYKKAYPTLDVEQNLREIKQWNIDNPTKQKTARGITAHINTWLSGSNQHHQVESNLPKWAQVLSAYTRHLTLEQVKIWEDEFKELLVPIPGQEEIVQAIRRLAGYSDFYTNRKGFINAGDIIRDIKQERQRNGKNGKIDADSIVRYIQKIQLESDLEKRWDMICEHKYPEIVRNECDRREVKYKSIYE